MTTDISTYADIVNINGSVDRGGWQCQFTALRDTDLVEINQNVLVNWQPMLGNGNPMPLRTAFNGHVIPSRFQADLTGSTANFTAETSDGYLRKGWLQGIGFAEIDTRTHYHQFSDDDTECPTQTMGYAMTLGKLVKHILGYYDDCNDIGPNWVAHTNMVYHATQNPNGWIDLDNVETSEWTVANTDGSMAVSRYNVRETDNLWSRLQEIARNEFFVIYFDKTNTVYYRKHPMYLSGALPTPVMTFDADFGLSPLIVEPRDQEQVRQVILHAVTDNGSTLDSEYPASPTHVYGKVEERTRIRCNDQDTLDDWAERLYAWLNRGYTVTWTAPGLCGLLFELLDRVQITYTGTSANGVHIDWTEKKFWIHDITVSPAPPFTGTSRFVLEAENV